MKKIFLLLFIFLLCGCTSTNDLMNEMEITGKCQKEREVDTHGGFLGDGDYFAKLSCTSVTLSSNWKELPVTESISKIMNLIQCIGKCQNAYEKYNIPSTINGSYYFYDRHSESSDRFDDKDLNNRSSYNFSLALYDKDTNTVYYYKMDT